MHAQDSDGVYLAAARTRIARGGEFKAAPDEFGQRSKTRKT